ncbi:hypothetical protein DL98DRAFT_170829 [Cadophora sp. DSE1049]|nr:hypothetical protein DL98DRAFT_170829 [Cadophora sp. DSE1049]
MLAALVFFSFIGSHIHQPLVSRARLDCTHPSQHSSRTTVNLSTSTGPQTTDHLPCSASPATPPSSPRSTWMQRCHSHAGSPFKPSSRNAQTRCRRYVRYPGCAHCCRSFIRSPCHRILTQIRHVVTSMEDGPPGLVIPLGEFSGLHIRRCKEFLFLTSS